MKSGHGAFLKARFQGREETTVRGSVTPKGLCGGSSRTPRTAALHQAAASQRAT